MSEPVRTAPRMPCLYRARRGRSAVLAGLTRVDPARARSAIAQAFSPRYERHHDDLVSIDVTGSSG